jgi:hypothetical protein
MWDTRRWDVPASPKVVPSLGLSPPDRIMSASPFTDPEHRWGQRFEVNIPVQVAIGVLKGIDGRLQNVSCSGGLLTADYELRLRSLLEIHVRLPILGHAMIEAHVTRASNGAVGLEWCEFASRAVKHLVRDALAAVRLAKPEVQKDRLPMYRIPFEGDLNVASTHRVK